MSASTLSVQVAVADRRFHLEMVQLAMKIADSCARSDIECYCVPQADGDGVTWYDTRQLVDAISDPRVPCSEQEREFVEDAVRYLDLRGGSLRRDPASPHIVSFTTEHRRCRQCGCTDNQACQGGCYWVEPDLCSACRKKGKR